MFDVVEKLFHFLETVLKSNGMGIKSAEDLFQKSPGQMNWLWIFTLVEESGLGHLKLSKVFSTEL